MRWKETYFESLLVPRLTTMNDLDLQSLQIAGKHPLFCIAQGGQVLRTRLPEDTSGERDEIPTLVHGTDRSVAIEEKFA